MKELFAARKRIKQLESLNKQLAARILSRERLHNEDAKVHCYTGLLSHEVLEIVFESWAA